MSVTVLNGHVNNLKRQLCQDCQNFSLNFCFAQSQAEILHMVLFNNHTNNVTASKQVPYTFTV